MRAGRSNFRASGTRRSNVAESTRMAARRATTPSKTPHITGQNTGMINYVWLHLQRVGGGRPRGSGNIQPGDPRYPAAMRRRANRLRLKQRRASASSSSQSSTDPAADMSGSRPVNTSTANRSVDISMSNTGSLSINKSTGNHSSTDLCMSTSTGVRPFDTSFANNPTADVSMFTTTPTNTPMSQAMADTSTNHLQAMNTMPTADCFPRPYILPYMPLRPAPTMIFPHSTFLRPMHLQHSMHLGIFSSVNPAYHGSVATHMDKINTSTTSLDDFHPSEQTINKIDELAVELAVLDHIGGYVDSASDETINPQDLMLSL